MACEAFDFLDAPPMRVHQVDAPLAYAANLEALALPRVEDIVRAVRTVARGRKFITPAVAEQLADGLGAAHERPLHEQLSERELQVFLRLAQGQTIGHLADSLCLSVKTVSTYRGRVMEKMRLASNSDLTYYALKNGLIQ